MSGDSEQVVAVEGATRGRTDVRTYLELGVGACGVDSK
jgi:hypothetical protein